MHIEKVTEVTDESFGAILRLVPQIGLHKPKPSKEELETLVDSGSSNLFVARFPNKDSQIVAMLTISIYRVPTGIRSIVEDVVVDESFRGKGIAKALIQKAIEVAQEAGANGVALTSNPQRAEANRLYLSLGFQKRETNAYYYKLK